MSDIAQDPDVTVPLPGANDQPAPGWTRGIDGRWYPPRPPRSRPLDTAAARLANPTVRRRPRNAKGLAFILLLAVALIVAIVIVVQSNDDDNVPRGSLDPAHVIGETVRTGDAEVTIRAVESAHSPANPAEAAPAGQHLLAVEVTVHNSRADRELSVLSNVLFELTDSFGTVQTQAVVSDLASIDGIFLPDDTRSGFVVFRVADSALAPLSLRVKGELSAGGVTFAIP